MSEPDFLAASCPIPLDEYPTVQLAHGGGGRFSHRLISDMFLTAFGNPVLDLLHDGAVLEVEGGRIAFSTDSFVVKPMFFPGGNIGSLAVHGTLNDVAMCGAHPLVLSAGFILEEGLPMEDLWAVVESMGRAAEAAGVPIVTGDTKVVDRGSGDGIYVNTSGIGVIPEGIDISPVRARPGDKIIVSGQVAVHGIAIMSVREGLEFETALESDTADLSPLVARVLDSCGDGVHVLRDPTRGGVASALNEIATSAGVGVLLDERAVPLGDEVRGACEILGFDPLYVANEGKVLVFVAPQCADEALRAVRSHPLGEDAAVIGEVVDEHPGRIDMRSRVGGIRVVDMLSGEQLPRIC